MKGNEDMFKKFLSIMLVFIICCSTSITVFTQEERSHIEGNDVSANSANNEESVTDNVNSNSTDTDTVTDSDYVHTETGSDYLQWLRSAPDEILTASTAELLEYFMNSQFLFQEVFCIHRSTFDDNYEVDLSDHEAFGELISREDLIDALDDYAETILYDSENNELAEWDRTAFEELIAQPNIASLVYDLAHTDANYSNLQSIYTTTDVTTSSIGEYVG